MKSGPLLIVWGHSLGTSIATITTNQWQGLDSKYIFIIIIFFKLLIQCF